MAEEPTPPNKTDRSNPALWLWVSIAPSLVSIPFLGKPSPGIWFPTLLTVLFVGCSLFAAFGLLANVRDQAGRIVLSLLLAGFLFALNVGIVVLIGCSRMTRGL